MRQSHELHLPQVTCKLPMLYYTVMEETFNSLHFTNHHSALQTEIKRTAVNCGPLSCNIGNCACFMDSEKAWQIFTHFLCNATVNILSCTVLCDPDLLHLLNPSLILIIGVIPLTAVLKCLHMYRLQFRLNHYYWSSSIRSRKKNLFYKNQET